MDEECVQHMANALHKKLPHAANKALDAPVTMDEMHLALRSGKQYKSPGCDGICQKFFKVTWEATKHDMLDIFNQMHSNNIGTTETRNTSTCAEDTYS
jgi:hypothetical protein